MAKILFADDHNLFLTAMVRLISDMGHVVEGVPDGSEGIKRLSQDSFDLVITDLQMPQMDGTEFTEFIKTNYPHVKVIVLTMHDSIKYMQHMVELGVQSFLHKSIELPELEVAITNVLDGKSYFPHSVGVKLAEELYRKAKMVDERLTERELKILQLIGEEKTVNEIAADLDISPRTVESHKLRMLEKMKVKSTIGLVKKAVQNGLIN